jgi:hypothetical protein
MQNVEKGTINMMVTKVSFVEVSGTRVTCVSFNLVSCIRQVL